MSLNLATKELSRKELKSIMAGSGDVYCNIYCRSGVRLSVQCGNYPCSWGGWNSYGSATWVGCNGGTNETAFCM